MKVLHVVSNISVGNGIMAVLMNYYRNIDRNRVQFGFLYYDDRKITYEKEIIQLGGEIIRLPNVRKYREFRCEKHRLAKRIFGEYQILHIHDVFMISFFADVKKLWGIKKIIIHSHATKLSDHILGQARNRILSIPNGWIPDYYFACSYEAGMAAFGTLFKKEGTILKNAIDVRKYVSNHDTREKMRQILGVDDDFVIGHVGGFTNQKNHKFIIEIFEKVLKRRENARLILVSEGPLKHQMEELCIRKQIDRSVMFLGTRNDVPDLMQSFDCFLLPSTYEGLGIVLVEAQAAGLPCIFSDVVPEDANILTESNRVLGLHDSADQWADAILDQYITDTEYGYERIQKAGYCIQCEALKLQNKYLEISGGRYEE